MRIPLSVIKHLLMITKLTVAQLFLAACLSNRNGWKAGGRAKPTDMSCDSIKTKYRANNVSTMFDRGKRKSNCWMLKQNADCLLVASQPMFSSRWFITKQKDSDTEKQSMACVWQTRIRLMYYEWIFVFGKSEKVDQKRMKMESKVN